MENSFFEYRDKTGVDKDSDDSDAEYIDGSLVEDVVYSTKKKNRTVFVAESDESTSNDESMIDGAMMKNMSKSVVQRSNAAEAHIHSSSEDDGSRKGSNRRPSQSQNSVVVSSSDEDEEELSPELVPKRRPPIKKLNDSNESIILRRTKKRMLFLDSDTDNSIVAEYDKNKKLVCLKETPIKINNKKTNVNESMEDDESCDGDDDKSDEECELQHYNEISSKYKKLIINSDDSEDEKPEVNKVDSKNIHDSDEFSKNDDDLSEDDDGPDEDMMLMSRATRMSIMGVIPKDNDSDESDFIQSDASSQKSKESIEGSLENLESNADISEEVLHNTPNKTAEHNDIITVTPDKSMESDDDLPKLSFRNSPKKSNEPDNKIQHVSKAQEISVDSDDDLPEVTIHKSLEKPVYSESDDDLPEVSKDDSRISCSPFSSPLQDVTNSMNIPSNNDTKLRRKSTVFKKNPKITDFMDLTVNMSNAKPKKATEFMDLTVNKPKDFGNAGVVDLSNVEDNGDNNLLLNKSASVLTRKETVFDDDVAIIDSNPEIIALISDDDDDKNDEVSFEKSPKSPPSKPPRVKKSPQAYGDLDSKNTIKQYLLPPSYPDQVVYVKKHVRKNELEKLTRLKEDLNSVRRLLDEMDMGSLPDGGSRLIQRLNTLEADVRRQGDKVANMLVETDQPTAADIEKDGFEKGLSWEDIQKASNAVQPRMFGKQADDMGLGKTITMIALVASDKQDRIDHEADEDEGLGKETLPRGGALVVCPASLLQQWGGEVAKHCAPHALSVCLHHGAARATHAHRLATYDVVATTYNILQRDNEKNGVLMRIQWRRIILDEAHIVRNHKSATSTAVCNLKGKRRWCLTGTPVQNKDLDLFALLKFLRCSPFDDLQMWKKWIDNKSQGGQERLSTLMRCILLRRTKVLLQQRGQLACLPARTPHLTLVTLAKDEMNVYQKVLVLSKTLFAQFLHQRAEKNSDAVAYNSKGKDSEYAKMHKKMVALQGVKPVKSHEILVLLLRLRQVCCHCGLIAGMLDSGADVPEEVASADLLRELDKLSLEDEDRRQSKNPGEEEEGPAEESAKADEAIRAVLSPNNPVFQLKRPSSKIAAVMKCLTENVFPNKGHKAVVVSQWTSVLRLVEHELKQLAVRCVTLSGAVPVPARPQLIHAVNDPASNVRVMLLSLCAGGVGINLCGANHLLLLDPHWNPQLEEQAQDRIYRVGQHRDVHVYRFVCVDTVEQSIRKLQEAKLQIAENVLTGARNTAASSLSIEDLKMLFNMGT